MCSRLRIGEITPTHTASKRPRHSVSCASADPGTPTGESTRRMVKWRYAAEFTAITASLALLSIRAMDRMQDSKKLRFR